MRRRCLWSVLTFLLGPGILSGQVFGPSGPEQLVNTYTTGAQGGGSVGMSDLGDFVVVWSGDGGEINSEVYARRYTLSGPVTASFRVDTHTTSAHGGAQVAVGNSGFEVVVWNSDGQDGDSGGVFGRRLSSGAAQGSEFLVNTVTTVGYQSYQQVASDGAGNFVVVWASPGTGPSHINVFGRRYSANGAAAGAEFRVNTYTTGYQTRPSVAASSSGFVVAWQSRDLSANAPIGIFVQRYSSAGAPVASPFQVNAATDRAANPAVGMDANGKFVVAWRAYTSAASLTDIYARRYGANGAALDSEFMVNTATADYQDSPLVTAYASGVDPTGGFVIAWTGTGLYGGQPGVFARRFTGTGVSLGGQFKVNSVDGGFPGLAGLSHDVQGDFVVGWTQGVPATQNVYLRLFCRALAGDVNNSGAIDIADVFYLINNLFAGGTSPACPLVTA